MSEILSRQSLLELVGSWLAAGKRVAGPRQVAADRVLYQPITAAEQLRLDGGIRPANSIKEFFFPRHEKLYSYRIEGKRIELHDCEEPGGEQLVLAARPCDAASLPILDRVFRWDCDDAQYLRRRELTTVVTLACSESDADCFCTSVGLGPQSERGSDVLLIDLGDGHYEARAITDKGRALLAGHTKTSNRVAPQWAGPEPWLDRPAVRQCLADEFNSPLWKTVSLACLGCGACAYTCPTCHCFDIADEGTASGGTRVRNWDACQFSLFTLHASGHNPRNRQWQRQRQRLTHKFRTYPEKFGETLCTGCGNCTRNCPAGLGVRPVLEALQQVVSTGRLSSAEMGRELLEQAARVEAPVVRPAAAPARPAPARPAPAEQPVPKP